MQKVSRARPASRLVQMREQEVGGEPGARSDPSHQVDLADSYKYISFPAACVVLVASLIFFGALWLRRKVSGG